MTLIMFCLPLFTYLINVVQWDTVTPELENYDPVYQA